MLKKLFSLMLICVLILPVFGNVNAADIPGDIEYKANVLHELNIMPNNDNTNNQSNVSKSEFINYICNMMGDYGYTSDNNEEAILFAEQSGIIKDRNNGTNAPLKYDEAVTMLVRALGYESIAEAKGGFPYGYTQVASNLGITDNTSPASVGFVKRYQAIQMLYNTLDINIAKVVAIKVGDKFETIKYDTTTNESLLYTYRKIYKVNGVLETSGVAGLRTGYAAEEGYVSIDGEFYAGTGYDDLLGHMVVAYIKEANDDDSIVYMYEDENRNRSISVVGKDVINVSSDFKQLNYYDSNDKSKNARISSTVAVIYNGLPYSDYTENTFKPKDGMIKLIDNNDDGVYDVVCITAYKTIVLDVISRLDKTVRNMYSFDSQNILVDLKEDDDTYIELVRDGESIAFNDLSRLDVLRIAESTSGGIRKVYVEVSRNVVSGSVVSTSNTDEGQKIMVEEQELYISDAFEDAIEKNDSNAMKFKLGDSCSFYLDSNGRVAYADTRNNDLKYAIVRATKSDGTFDIEHQLRVFTSEGEWKIYTLKEKVTCNGQKNIAAQTVINKIAEVKAENIIVVMGYKLNSKGEIMEVELPLLPGSEYDEDRMNIAQRTNIGYKNNTKSFMSQIFVDSSAIIWSVDNQNLSDDSSYSAESSSILAHNSFYSFTAYNVDEFNFANIFVIETNASTIAKKLEESELFVVTNIGMGLNSEGNAVPMVKGAMGAYEEVTWFSDVPEVTTDLSEGDVICVYANKTGNVTNKEKYYSISDGASYKAPTPNLLADSAILCGKIVKNDLSNSRIKINCGEGIGGGDYVFRTDGTFSVLIYDKQSRNNKVHFGTINDIVDPDFVVVKIKQGVLHSIVAIR